MFQNNLMKNKSTLFQIRKKHKIVISLKPLEEKNPCKNLFFFFKYEESLVKFSGKSENVWKRSCVELLYSYIWCVLYMKKILFVIILKICYGGTMDCYVLITVVRKKWLFFVISKDITMKNIGAPQICVSWVPVSRHNIS